MTLRAGVHPMLMDDISVLTYQACVGSVSDQVRENFSKSSQRLRLLLVLYLRLSLEEKPVCGSGKATERTRSLHDHTTTHVVSYIRWVYTAEARFF